MTRRVCKWFLAGMVICCLVGAGWSPALGAEKHSFTFDDYAALRSARAVAVSPDGKTILYVVSYFENKGRQKSEWRVIDMTGENSRKLSLPEEFRPIGFMKDGASIYGSYVVGKSGQLAIVPLAGGTPTVILALANGIRFAEVSPDGTRFASLADPDEKDPLAGVHNVMKNDHTSLYVMDTKGAGGGWWCSNLKDIAEIAWSPDSSQIAVVSQTPKIGNHSLHSFIDLCTASGTRRIADIANSTAGIAWTNGGKELVFASTTTSVLTPDHVWTVSVSGGNPVDRTPDLEGSAVSLKSDPSGMVWINAHRGVSTEVHTLRDGKFDRAFRWAGGVVDSVVYPMFSSSPMVPVFTMGDPSHATNLAVIQNGELKRITNEGDDTLAAVNLGEVRTVHWTAKDGTKLEGILTLPGGYVSGKKYPFLVLPHGGPESNDQLDFDNLPREIAGQGYVVLQPQYRGSTGYGSAFLDAIYQHFGDRAFSDVDSATDFAIAQGWADPNRLAIFGWSAGGFMTSWTVTQTGRYKAAIEGAGITDWLSFIPTSDTWQTDYDARLQEQDPNPMLQFSAVMHADKVTTPLLILHGEADIRVPTFQGQEFFVLLAERGKTVRMVTYPGSPHFPSLIEQRRDVFKEIADWLKKFIS